MDAIKSLMVHVLVEVLVIVLVNNMAGILVRNSGLDICMVLYWSGTRIPQVVYCNGFPWGT